MPQDVGGDFDQVATQFAFVPTGKDISHFLIGQIQQLFHHPIGFSNQLHITIFDTVVNHLHKMTRSGRAYPLATGSAVRCFCRNALKDRFHFRPCFLRTAGHDRSSIQGSFFTAGHSATDEEKSFRLRQFDAAVGIFVIGVTAINKDVSR